MSNYRGDLVDRVSQAFDGDRVLAEAAVDEVLRQIRALTTIDDMLILKGFGTFSMRHRRESTTRNPRTGAPMTVPASTRLHFKASKV